MGQIYGYLLELLCVFVLFLWLWRTSEDGRVVMESRSDMERKVICRERC